MPLKQLPLMRRRLTFLLGAAITLMVVIVAYRSVRRPAAVPQTDKDNTCYLRIAAQDLPLPIKSYITATSDGTSERHEPDQEGEFARVKWADAVRGLHIDLGNIGIFIDHKHRVLNHPDLGPLNYQFGKRFKFFGQ